MSVSVVARVNRQVDYAALYSSVQAKLDKHDDTLTKLQASRHRQHHVSNDRLMAAAG